MNIVRNVTGVTMLLAAASACATKGYVRRQVQAMADTTKMGYTAADSSVRSATVAEITTVRSEVQTVGGRVDSVRTRLEALEKDLAMLRDSLGARITAMENSVEFIFPVTFAFNDATVPDKDRAALDKFAKVIGKHYSGTVMTVEGFADPAGSSAYNRKLSTKRAENVAAYLQQAGLSGVDVRPVGMGETRLVVKGAERDMPGAESNRRVVFVIETGRSQTSSVSVR